MCAARSDATATARLKELSVDEIDPNKRNPRLVFPQAELDRLAESIDHEGILVPIVVFPKGDRYVLVDGERRFRCALILGLPTVPALITSERSEREVLVQMFNIHLVREAWRDIPTARAMQHLEQHLIADGQAPVTDQRLRDETGLSLERVRRLRYVLSLPLEWQDYISDGTIPLNFFWELKTNVVDALARYRPRLLDELGAQRILAAFVEKRLDGVITDTVGLRKVRPIIHYAAADAGESDNPSVLDKTIRDLVEDPTLTVDEAYEDTVQIMVEADKLGRRTRSMVASFERLLGKARNGEERDIVQSIGEQLVNDLTAVLNR